MTIESLKKALFVCFVIVTATFIIFPADLWNDEAFLAYSITDTNWTELHIPMVETNQSAPIGYLYLSKLIYSIFGVNDLSTRLLPFIGFIILIMLFIKQKGKNIWSFFIFFSMSRFFLYGYDVKQYLFDVLSVYYLYFWFDKNKKGNDLNLFNIFLLTTLSNVALFLTFPIVLLKLLHRYIISKKIDKSLVLFVFIQIIEILIIYSIFYYDNPMHDYMQSYWKEDFFPMNKGALSWIYNHWITFAKYNISLPTIILKVILLSFIMSLFIYAMYHLFKDLKNNFIHIILYTLPFGVNLILSAAKIFPFDSERISLFLVVPFIYLIPKYANNIKNPILYNIVLYLTVITLIYSFYRIIKHKILSPPQSLSLYMAELQSHNQLFFLHGASSAQFKYYNHPTYNGKKKIWKNIKYLDPVGLENYQSNNGEIVFIELHDQQSFKKIPKTLLTQDSVSYNFKNSITYRYSVITTYSSTR